MAIEIVDFPINSMVIFHSYVKLPGGTMIFNSFPEKRIRYIMYVVLATIRIG